MTSDQRLRNYAEAKVGSARRGRRTMHTMGSVMAHPPESNPVRRPLAARPRGAENLRLSFNSLLG